jgi:hypothetical protein
VRKQEQVQLAQTSFRNKRSMKHMQFWGKNVRLQCLQKKWYEPTHQTPAISVMDMGVHTYISPGTHISWVSPGLSPLLCGCAVYVSKVLPKDNPGAFGGLHQVFALTREF